MIFEGSRYDDADVLRAKWTDGKFRPVVFRAPAPNRRTVVFKLVTVRSDMRPDILAFEELGDPFLWWTIADLNPEIFDFSDIPAGTVLRVPVP